MDFRNAGEAAEALGDFAELFLPVFVVAALHGGGEFDGLGEGFVSAGVPLRALVNGKLSARSSWRGTR